MLYTYREHQPHFKTPIHLDYITHHGGAVYLTKNKTILPHFRGMPPRLPHALAAISCPLAQSVSRCCVIIRASTATTTHGPSIIIASTSPLARQPLLLRCNGSHKRGFRATTRHLAQSAFEGKNHYERLNLPLDASVGEIKKSVQLAFFFFFF